jgi:hypothetical protein
MIDAIITGLVSGGTSETAKELYKRIAIGLGALLRAKQAPASANEAVEKLELGQVDQAALRNTLALLNERDLAAIAEDVKALSRVGATTINEASLNFSGARISGSTITGISTTIGKT